MTIDMKTRPLTTIEEIAAELSAMNDYLARIAFALERMVEMKDRPQPMV